MQWTPLAVVLALAVSLTGCKSLVSPEDYRIQPEPYIAQSDPTQATVVFLWTDPRIKTVALPIYQDGVQVGALKSNTYARHIVPPGSYKFATALGFLERTTETVWLRVEAGQRYFLQFTTGLGGAIKPHALELIGEDVALQHLVGLPRTEIINVPTSGDSRTASTNK
jgi:hypothetical protein